MVDAVHSGYKQDLTAVTISGLATLAGATYSATSTIIDQDQAKNLAVDLVLTLGNFSVDPTADLFASIYLIPVVDGTTEPYWAAGGTTSDDVNESYFIGSITFNGASTGDEYVLRSVSLPAGKFKFAVRNQCAQPFVGATLEYRPWQFSSQ